MEKFLFAVDHQTNDLFILHREFPACLMQVIHTTPVTLRIVDLYDNIDKKELTKHPFLEDAKAFWRENGKKIAGYADSN